MSRDAGQEERPTPTLDREGERTHPLTGLVRGGSFAGAALVALGFSYVQGDGWGGLPWWLALLIGLVGGLVVGVLAGMVSWWFTRYVVDDTELRIDSGVITKQSRRIPFERLQSVDVAEPVLARVVGLAELRLTMAGGAETGTTLRFLTRSDAERLRSLLLRLAHGADESGPDGDSDSTADELITRVPPERAVLGVALSLDFFGAVGALIVIALAAIGLREPLVFFGGFVPVAAWAVRIVATRVIAQWGFSLFRTRRGLRIERGLLSRTSQTIPYARVQGVRRSEPLVWRKLGWQRLDVDVAGYAGQAGDDPTGVSSVLLPIADAPLADRVVEELVSARMRSDAPDPTHGPGHPQGDLTPHDHTPDTHEVRAARSGRIFAPIGWRYRWIRLEANTAVSGTGWIERRTSVIPFDKAQSVAVTQGPWQRRLALASVHLHTPKGPVDVDAHHVPAEDARELALDAVERARAARARPETERVQAAPEEAGDQKPST